MYLPDRAAQSRQYQDLRLEPLPRDSLQPADLLENSSYPRVAAAGEHSQCQIAWVAAGDQCAGIKAPNVDHVPHHQISILGDSIRHTEPTFADIEKHLAHRPFVPPFYQRIVFEHPVRHVPVMSALNFHVEDGVVLEQLEQVHTSFLDSGELDVQEGLDSDPANEFGEQTRLVSLEQLLEQAIEVEAFTHVLSPMSHLALESAVMSASLPACGMPYHSVAAYRQNKIAPRTAKACALGRAGASV